MDKYQSYIKSGEPVVLLNPAKYGSSVGTFICRHPAIGLSDVIGPHNTDWTTDSLINVGEDGEHNPFVVPDHEWIRIDPESSLYKIIMWKRRGSMFQMHQVVDIVDGFYRGKTGFINGIHVDANTNEYVIRLNNGDPEDPATKPVEVQVPGWCLANHAHGRFNTEQEASISEDERRGLVSAAVLKSMKAILDDDIVKAAVQSAVQEKVIEITKRNMRSIIASAMVAIDQTIDDSTIDYVLKGSPVYGELIKACTTLVAQEADETDRSDSE